MKSKWELLDSGNVSDIIKSKKLHEDLVKFHWKYYSELAFQRTLIREELNASLCEVATGLYILLLAENRKIQVFSCPTEYKG
jgi:hypothetical protein